MQCYLWNYSTFSYFEMTPLKQPNSYVYLGLFLDFLFCFTGLSTHVPVPQYFNGLIFGRINSLQVPFLLGILMAILFYVFFSYINFRITYLVLKICIFIGSWWKFSVGRTDFYDDVIPNENISSVFSYPLEISSIFMLYLHISD